MKTCRRILIVQAHPDAGAGHFGDALVGHAANEVTLSRRTSVGGKARERRRPCRAVERAERSPRRLCGGPPGATVPARLGVAFLGKGAAIPCETRLDSHRHSGSERYLISRMAH